MLEYSYKIYTQHEKEYFENYQLNPWISIKGTVVNNQLENDSLIQYTDGSKVQGNFLNGQLDGQGMIHLPKINTNFEGNFEQGYKNGEGVLETETKIYIGTFKNDFMHGVFKVIDKNRMVFSFQKFVYDKRESYLEEFDVLTRELVFKGSWIDNKNEGICYENNKDYVYEGCYTKGLKNGQGKIIYKNSHIIYEGEFASDFP